MPWNLLLIPLIAGYFLVTKLYCYKFKQQRLDQQRLIFETIFVGVVLLVITFILESLIKISPSGEKFIDDIYSYVPIPDKFAGTAVATLPVALLINFLNIFSGKGLWWGPYHLIKPIYAKQKYLKNAIDEVGNEFEKIIKSSFNKDTTKDDKPLLITLDNRKFYIALPLELPIPSISTYVRILPIMSGYRDDEHLLKFNTEYISMINSTNRYTDDFVAVVIDIKKIITISYFDINKYSTLHGPQSEEIKVQT